MEIEFDAKRRRHDRNGICQFNYWLPVEGPKLTARRRFVALVEPLMTGEPPAEQDHRATRPGAATFLGQWL